MDRNSPPTRRTWWIRLAVIAILVVAAIILLRFFLPLREMAEALGSFVHDLGLWGPVVFALAYAIATIFMMPGWTLTVVAGAMFGLMTGTLSVWLGATAGAAGAFVIARYLARPRVELIARRSAKFDALDHAVAEGGWKIVALLRLTPVVPFNVQNYLYGLTKIRFWPCLLTSWIAMLPGTFMYVYIGYLGREGARAAASQEQAANTGQCVLLGAGGVATIVFTWYITKLARRQLARLTSIAEKSADDEVMSA